MFVYVVYLHCCLTVSVITWTTVDLSSVILLLIHWWQFYRKCSIYLSLLLIMNLRITDLRLQMQIPGTSEWTRIYDERMGSKFKDHMNNECSVLHDKDKTTYLGCIQFWLLWYRQLSSISPLNISAFFDFPTAHFVSRLHQKFILLLC